MDKKLFGDLAFGIRFIFYGKTYTKIALNMVEDEKRSGHILQAETKVEPIECAREPEFWTFNKRIGSRILTRGLVDHKLLRGPGTRFEPQFKRRPAAAE